ncbi:transposase [Tissierella creatinini]|nr:transposase [Tissierella creatinini]TJX59540.1 transposase [Soehngenia saccharolytica]
MRRNEQSKNKDLKNSRYLWLSNPEKLKEQQRNTLEKLSGMNLKTARAYRVKLAFQDIYKNFRIRCYPHDLARNQSTLISIMATRAMLMW